MSGRLYALLVGIDAYPAPVPRLRGCRNDIEALEQLLTERVADADRDVQKLLDADASRAAVIAGLTTHLTRAEAGDVALFWYSGHGSQETAPPEFWPVEPDHLDETLVCHDSRTGGQFDLADKELAQLLAEVAAKGAHVVVVLDCCHSGSGTRGDEDGGQAVRRAPVDRRVRPLDTMRLPPTALSRIGAAAAGSPGSPASGWLVFDEGRHVLLAACRSTQTAKEVIEAGRQRGALSAALEKALRTAPTSPTYRDLMTAVGSLVRDAVAEQHPQLEYTDAADLDRPFLGGAVRPRGASYTLISDPAAGWLIDAGAVHGVPQPDGDETTVLAVYPAGTADEDLRRADLAVTTASVRAVEPGRSLVTPAAADRLDPTRAYRAVPRSLPLARYAVTLAGDAAPVAAVAVLLAGSLLLVEDPARAEAHVEAVAGAYRITRAGSARRLVTDVEAAETVVSRLEHIARWQRIRSLRNDAGALGPGAVLMEVLDPATGAPIAGSDNEVVLRYAEGAAKGPTFVVRLTNTTDRDLHCALLGLNEAYAVTSGLISGGRALLPAGGTVLAVGGKAIRATVPDELFAVGVDRYTDTLKLIACTEEFDASQLDQGDLDVPLERRGAARGAAPRTTLQRLVDRVQTRTLTVDDDEDENADWVTSDLSIVTERNLGATPIGAAEAELAGSAVVVAAHPTLRATARVRSEPGPARDADTALLPPPLRDDPDASEPFALSSTRSGAAEATVLELRDVENWQDVTPADPLRITVPVTLRADEHVLPIGFDGEFYLPLGVVSRRAADGVEIRLDTLPDPITDRSLVGSIKILFRKLVLAPLGVADPYPLLSLVTPDGAGGLTYDTHAAAAAVANADRVLLYVHGILGDTRGIVASAFPDGLAAAYDAVLAFDYENLHTRIDETAALLRARLDEVGLRPGGATLDVVAHSMGGLVVRWMVEHLDGADIVSSVTTLGTPNAGSPWPRVQDWAFSALSIGLNSLASSFWPAGVLAGLVGLVERVDNALDDLAPGSDRLQRLFTAPDPHVPYTVLVGDRSLVERPEPDGRIARLLARIARDRLVDPVVALAFLGAPNDLAVAVSSAEHLPVGRDPAPAVRRVASDHMSYFVDPAGRDALAAALGVPRP